MILHQPYKAEHLDKLVLQKAQKHIRQYLTYDTAKALETNDAYTFVSDGAPICCCGLIRFWPGRALMWCFLSDMRLSDKLSLTRMIKDYIGYIDIDRLEIYVDVDFEGGHKWAKMLGFECEAPRMKKFQVNGTDSAMYARVK